MRLYLVAAVVYILALQCNANPITVTADSDKSEIAKDIIQQTEQSSQQFVQKQEASKSDKPAQQDIQPQKGESEKQEEEKNEIPAAKPSEEKTEQKKVDDNKRKQRKIKGRQSEDEDDDDDDDDLDIGVGDDDDDDDDDSPADDDDDDEDYFERLFDDILGGGGDDDDDYDDDESPSTGSEPAVAEQPAASSAETAETAPVSELTPSEELDAQEAAEGAAAAIEPIEQGQIATNDLQEAESAPQGQAIENSVVTPAAANDEDEDDDDDDDDDDALAGIADEEDDDDEETEDDDDEDDDDEDDLSDVISARRRSSRKLKHNAQPVAQPKMPAIYISKYNRFVDNVINRINRILGKSFDPVRVKLQSPSEVKKAQKQQQKNKNKSKGKGNKGKGRGKNPGQQQKTEEMKNKMAELPVQRSENTVVKEDTRTIESESREPSFVLISKTGSEDTAHATDKPAQNSAAVPPQERETNVIRKNSKPKRKNTTKAGNKNKNKTKQGNNSNKNKKPPKAKATLFGLSSIKRDGDVVVNMQSDHTTVKSNFVLGPLTLRVEREYGKNGRRELKSATATTAEMYGRINLRLVHGGAATLHSIRVLQPKQVRIDSPDDHDKTREFLWKRSAHIASMVTSKLANAARSMLKPPPSN